MKDFLVRGTVSGREWRFAAAETTALCRDGIIAHNCDPAGGAVLADALSSAALLSVLLDGTEKYSVKLSYSGTAGTVLADTDAAAGVRGMMTNPQPGDGHTMDTLFGAGEIPVTVIKYDGGSVLNSGTVNCGMGTPSANIAMFFSVSDQIETEIATVCRFRPDPADPVVHAAAFMLQAMPGCDLEEFAAVREKLHTRQFREVLGDGSMPMELQIKKLLKELDSEGGYTQSGMPGFRCGCSPESMKRALRTLGQSELSQLFAAKESVRMNCRFCGRKYEFTQKDI